MGLGWGRPLRRIGRDARDLRTAVWRAVLDFGEDRCTQWAAAMSYYVLFSIFPLVLVIVAVASLFVSESYVREQAIDWITDNVGLTSEGREDIERLLDRAIDGVGAIGLIGLVALVWSASAMMGALRHAVNNAWGVETRRHFLRGKALDLLLVAALFLLFVASVALTFVVQYVDRVPGITRLSPLLISFVSFLLIYRVVPAVRTRFRDVWIGALIASVLFEGAKTGLAFYFANFSNYDEVYGSLGAVISFLFFVWVAGAILLFGAEVAAEWPRVRAGIYDSERFSTDAEGPPVLVRLRTWVRGEATRAVARKPSEVLPSRRGHDERARGGGGEGEPGEPDAGEHDDRAQATAGRKADPPSS